MLRNWLSADDDGAIAPVAIMLMVVLIGFCAFAIDVGNVYVARRGLQNAADAGALAGARDVETIALGGVGNPRAQALTYASTNGVPGAGSTCTPDGQATVTYNDVNPNRPNSWQVSISRLVPLSFGGIIGIKTMCVSTTAVAVVTTGAVAKVFPFSLFSSTTIPPLAKPGSALQSCDPNASTLNQYCFVLKEGSSGSASGNFGILDFVCSGNQQKSANYIYWTENGFGSRPGETIPGPIPPTQWTVCTYTGNTASANNTIDSWVASLLSNPPSTCPPNSVADFRCPLIGLLPILKETSFGSGSSGTVTIVKFLIFEILGLTTDHATGHQQILGQFVQAAAAVGPTAMPDPSGTLSGALTIRLVQ